MPFQPVPGGIEIVIEYVGPEQTRMVNVFHARWAGGGAVGPGLLTLVSAQVDAWVIANWKPIASQGYGVVGFTLKSLETAEAPVQQFTYGSPQMGLYNSPAMPNNVTLAVKLLTGLSGRSARGRTYYVGLGEGNVLGNFVVAPTTIAIQAMFEALRTKIATVADVSLAVLSRQTGGVVRPQGVMYTVIQIALGDSRIDTQRRRLPRLSGQG